MANLMGGSLERGWSRLTFLYLYGLFDQEVTGTSVSSSDQSLEAHVAVLALDYAFGAGVEGRIAVPAGMIAHDTPDEDQTLAGFGDIDLQLNYRISELWAGTAWAPRLTFMLGLRLPTGASGRTGSTETEAAIADATGESIVPPTLLALGSGAFGLTAAVTLDQPLHPRVILNLPLRVRAPLTYNTTGVRFGTGLDYGLGITVRVGGGVSWTASATGRYLTQAEEREKGTVLQSGGHWFAAETGLGWGVTERLSVGARVRVPFYQDLNGTQLTERVSVFSFVAWRFGGDSDEPSSAESSTVKPYLESPPGVDDLAKGGATFDAAQAPILGAVTVVEFWGEWCGSCKAKLETLIAFQKKHPNDMALRRVEVPDFESPVALDHMPDVAGLPYMWVYDRKGVRRHVLSGQKECAEVEAIVLRLMAE